MPTTPTSFATMKDVSLPSAEDERARESLPDPALEKWFKEKKQTYQTGYEKLLKAADDELKELQLKGMSPVEGGLSEGVDTPRKTALRLMQSADTGEGSIFAGLPAPDPPRHRGVLVQDEEDRFTTKSRGGAGLSVEYIQCYKGTQRVQCAGGADSLAGGGRKVCAAGVGETAVAVASVAAEVGTSPSAVLADAGDDSAEGGAEKSPRSRASEKSPRSVRGEEISEQGVQQGVVVGLEDDAAAQATAPSETEGVPASRSPPRVGKAAAGENNAGTTGETAAVNSPDTSRLNSSSGEMGCQSTPPTGSPEADDVGGADERDRLVVAAKEGGEKPLSRSPLKTEGTAEPRQQVLQESEPAADAVVAASTIISVDEVVLDDRHRPSTAATSSDRKEEPEAHHEINVSGSSSGRDRKPEAAAQHRIAERSADLPVQAAAHAAGSQVAAPQTPQVAAGGESLPGRDGPEAARHVEGQSEGGSLLKGSPADEPRGEMKELATTSSSKTTAGSPESSSGLGTDHESSGQDDCLESSSPEKDIKEKSAGLMSSPEAVASAVAAESREGSSEGSLEQKSSAEATRAHKQAGAVSAAAAPPPRKVVAVRKIGLAANAAKPGSSPGVATGTTGGVTAPVVKRIGLAAKAKVAAKAPPAAAEGGLGLGGPASPGPRTCQTGCCGGPSSCATGSQIVAADASKQPTSTAASASTASTSQAPLKPCTGLKRVPGSGLIPRSCGQAGCPHCGIRAPEKNMHSACEHEGNGAVILPKDEDEITLDQLPEALERKPFDQENGLKTTVTNPKSLFDEKREMPAFDPKYAEQYMLYAQQYGAYSQQFALYAQYCAQQGAVQAAKAEFEQAKKKQQEQLKKMQKKAAKKGKPIPPDPSQPKPMMITPYRHNWLLSGNSETTGETSWWEHLAREATRLFDPRSCSINPF